MAIFKRTLLRNCWFLTAGVLSIATGSAFSRTGVSESPAPLGRNVSTLQVNIFCENLKTTTDFRITIDEHEAGRLEGKDKGYSPCLERLQLILTPGKHTLGLESKTLETSGSLAIVVQPGKNWVVVTPRKAPDGNHPMWGLSLRQHTTQPQFL